MLKPGGTDAAVIGSAAGSIPGPQAGSPRGVWVLDGSDFPKQGRKSLGVARQYCGRLGKAGQLPGGDVPGLRQPAGTGIGGRQGLYLPESWISDQDRCAAAGVPEERLSHRSKTELALELLERALGWATSRPDGLPGTTPSGCRRPFGSPWRAWGALRAGRSGQHSGLAPGVGLDQSGVSAGIRAAPASPGSGTGSVVPSEQYAVASFRIRLGGR